MKQKNYEPIKFEFFQTDMEKIMYQLEKAISSHDGLFSEEELKDHIRQMASIKEDLQHKINWHKRNGDWI